MGKKTLPFPSPPLTFPNLISNLLESIEEASAGVLSPALPLLRRLTPILLSLRSRQPPTPLPILQSLDSLQSLLNQSHSLVKNNPADIRMVADSVRDLGRCLSGLLVAWDDAAPELRDEITALQREMMAAELGSRRGVRDVEDVVLVIRRGADEELGDAVDVLEVVIGDGLVGEEDMVDVIQALLNRLGSAKHGYRIRIIVMLRKLAGISDDNKEIMANSEALSNIVKSLSRDVEESREAVALLLLLGDVLKFRQRIGRAKGCIMMLVALLNGADPFSSRDAVKLLGALSSNTQNVLLMAEAGFFVPLVQYLKEGSDMNKVLMATTISRMELTDQMKTTLGEEGSVELLVKMFISGKMEAKLSSLNAIKNLSCSKENDERLINSGLISHLLQILFSVTSVLLTLREPAAAILANLAKSESFLHKKDVAQQILSLLNLSSSEIQVHLLHALSSITSHPGAKKIRAKMKESEAMQILTPFLVTSDDEIRIATLSLLLNLSRYFAGAFSEQLGEFYLIVIVGIISKTRNEMEKITALGIISNIPANDKNATQILMNVNLLPLLITLTAANAAAATTPARTSLLDNIAAIMVRFTVPSDKKLQKVSAGHGIIPSLIKLLSVNSIAAKSRAAMALAQLSHNTVALSNSRSSRWFCTPEKPCRVHGGRCLVRSTFCLVKAGAVSPLVEILEGKERDADEAVLAALSTLFQDEIFEGGSEAVEEAAGVQAIMRVLQIGSLKAQEKAIWMLERVFRIGGHRSKYGEVAQNLLIDLALKADPVLKPMIGMILAHLQLLEIQSSYF